MDLFTYLLCARKIQQEIADKYYNYIYFDIDDSGFLQLYKSDTADDITFSLDDNGNLIMSLVKN